MERAVYNLQFLAGGIDGILVDYLLLQLCDITVVHFFADNFVHSRCLRFFRPHGLHRIVIRHSLHFVHNTLVVGRGDLRAILPVYLISVILRRVMTGCNVDTGDAAKRTHCIRQFRRRTQRFEDISLNSIGCQAQSRLICKFRRHPAGIVCDCHALLLPVLADNIIRKTLGRLSHRINIHTIRSCTDDSPKAGCPEFQILIKTLLDLVIIIGNAS